MYEFPKSIEIKIVKKKYGGKKEKSLQNHDFSMKIDFT